MKVLVEGYADRFLVRFLGIPKEDILHARSKGEVVRRLKDRPGDIGIVDEDPESTQIQSHELAHYREADKREGLRLLVREGHGGQKLVVLCPRLEDWLMRRAEICDIDPRQFHLPDTAKALHEIPRYEQKDGFRRFLADLNSRDRGMGILRQWVLQGKNL